MIPISQFLRQSCDHFSCVRYAMLGGFVDFKGFSQLSTPQQILWPSLFPRRSDEWAFSCDQEGKTLRSNVSRPFPQDPVGGAETARDPWKWGQVSHSLDWLKEISFPSAIKPGMAFVILNVHTEMFRFVWHELISDFLHLKCSKLAQVSWKHIKPKSLY